MDFFPSLFLLDLSLSFSPSFPSGHLVSIVCLLIRAAIFHLTLAYFVDLSFVIIFPQAFVFSFFLGLFCFPFFFCHRHLHSVFFFACLVLVLVFWGVSLSLKSFLGRQCVVLDFRWFSVLSNVQIKLETLYGASSFHIICSIGLSFPQSSLLLRLVQTLSYRPKNTKTIWPCPYCSLGNLLTVRKERNVTWYLDWRDCSKSVAFLIEALW